MEITKWFIHIGFIKTQGLIFSDHHWVYFCIIVTPLSTDDLIYE